MSKHPTQIKHKLERLYLASTFEDRKRIREYRDQLADLNIEVTSRWIEHDDSVTANDPNENLHDNALLDLADVRRADALVLFNDIDGGRGGRWVEMGFALNLLMPIYIIGKGTNAFCHMDCVFIRPTWEDFLQNPIRRGL